MINSNYEIAIAKAYNQQSSNQEVDKFLHTLVDVNNENKSSKHMELLAHSILKLICKEAASETYRGALETLQKMMSECIYHEGNAFVIMGVGEQLKRIKYDVDENNLKVFNVHFDNNEELVTDGEPDVVCLSK
jgi:Mn-containing catalase